VYSINGKEESALNEALYNQVITLFKQNNGYAYTGELTRLGVHTATIKLMEDEGNMIKVKRGLYRWADYDMDPDKEWVDVSKIVPGGVICLLSALSYYELTTYQPWEHYVAIHRGDTRSKLPDYPPIKLMYFSESQYQLGITELDMDDHKVRIYDIEKTLCDSARYQNKIGTDIVKESFKAYFKRPNMNIEKLIDYATKTRVKSVVTKYAEVLL
jgi:predicted transcriptional regulator of viral defense system